jgi:RNA polymerase sigma factor (sigma-70 family)
MEAALPALSEDDALMARVAAGDRTAFALLFDRHKGKLFGYLYHLVGDRMTAEDLLSETFLRVYQARARYRGTNFAPWLLVIARNLALGELRRRRTQQQAADRLAAEARQPARGETGAESEMRERVRMALLKLPEDQRTALVLREYQELSYREIGQVLGCSEHAARARTYRARGALRSLLRDCWDTGEEV